MDISIIILNFNTPDMTIDCIKSVIKNTKRVKYEIILIDNGSIDDSVIKISNLKSQISNLKIITNKKNLGFAEGNNIGIKSAKGRYVLLLNSDTLISSNVIGEMVAWLDTDNEIGIASCSLKNADGTEQGTGGNFPNLLRVFAWMTFLEDIPYLDKLIKPFHPYHSKSPLYKGDTFYKFSQNLDWVTGAFFMIRRNVMDDIGVFDKEYFMYTEEVDFCYRAKQKGWLVKYDPRWSIIHFGGASSQKDNNRINSFSILAEFRGIKLFYKKHMPSWQYPLVRLLLKFGSLLRIVVFGLVKGNHFSKVYAESFIKA